MKLTKLATTGVALLASAALVFGGASAANAAYPPATGISVSGASAGAAGASVTYTVKTTKSGRVSGETVRTTLNGKSNTTYFNPAGVAKVTVKYPALAGKYSVVFSAFGKTASKTITVGKAVALSLSATDTKTVNSLFTGVTGKGAKVKITVTNPEGVVASTTVVANAKTGKYQYRYTRATIDGTYTVKAVFVQTSKNFGSSTKTVTFEKN